MKKYEVKKCKVNRNRWYVYIDGQLYTYFSTKRAAMTCVEIAQLEEKGEVFNPLHPRWKELMSRF